MLNFGPTFIWVAVNLIVLYLVLKRILFKPVTQFMENRTRSIKDSIEKADSSRAEAIELRHKYEEQLKTAKEESDKILNGARGRAGREYDSIIGAARKEADAMLANAGEEIGRERAQMVRDLKNQVAGLALAAASKVIEANMDTARNRTLVDDFINKAGAA